VDTGIDRTYVSRIERRLENPTVTVLERIAAALGVEIAMLFVDPGPEAETPPSLPPIRATASSSPPCPRTSVRPCRRTWNGRMRVSRCHSGTLDT